MEANKDIVKPRTVSYNRDGNSNAITIDLANQPQNPEDRAEITPISESVSCGYHSQNMTRQTFHQEFVSFVATVFAPWHFFPKTVYNLNIFFVK